MKTSQDSAEKPTKKYWAFISYSSKDKKWGKWLHNRLENYPIPKEFQGTDIFDGDPLGKNLSPCFRDRDELAGSSDLGPPILKALKNSRYLVVLCSKNSAKSKWVDKEITDFKALHPENEKRILALILDGEPNAIINKDFSDSEECFPPALRAPHEPLAGDLRKDGDGKERGFLKVLAGISQIGFDTLYRRHERTQRKKRFLLASTAILAITILSTLTTYAFQQKNLAEQERLKSTRTLAHGDYIQAQQYRTSGDYIMAFTHLARSLKNNPKNSNAANLAWAMITNENLAFHYTKSPAPEDIIDIVLCPNANYAVWIDINSSVYIADVTSSGLLSNLRHLLTLSEPIDPKSSRQGRYLNLETSGHISLKDGEHTINIDPATGQQTKILNEAGNSKILKEIGEEAYKRLRETVEAQQVSDTNHILVDHPHVDKFAEIYRDSDDLDSIIFDYLGNTAREKTTAYITPSGKILISETRPIHQAYFIKELNTVLIESSDYVGARYLTSLKLDADFRYCYHENFYSNLHQCRWVVDQTNKCLIASTEQGAYAVVYDSPDKVEEADELLRSGYQGKSKLAQRKASCLLVCESPILTASYNKQNNTLAVVGKDHFYQFKCALFSERITPEDMVMVEKARESQGTIDTLGMNQELTEDFEILSQSTHNNKLLSHLIDLNLIGPGSPVSVPMPVTLETNENLFFIGNQFWEYSHTTLLCIVDHENNLVINQGYLASNHTIIPGKPYIASHPFGRDYHLYWCPIPQDSALESLPEILNSLVMAKLDENNQLTPYPSILKTTPKPRQDAFYPTTWHALHSLLENPD